MTESSGTASDAVATDSGGTPPNPSTTASGGNGFLHRLGGFSARHAWPILIAWILLLIVTTVGHRALGGTYSDDFTLPDSPAQAGASVLSAHQPSSGGQNAQVVFTGTGIVSHRASIERTMAAIRALPHVKAATDPLVPGTVSGDGGTAYATVTFDQNPVVLGPDYVTTVDGAVAPARADGVHVDYGGPLGQAARPKAKDVRSELIGIVIAIVVLLIGFGSVYAAGLPILSAILGVFTGVGVLGMIASAVTFATVSPTLAVMMGLGVGIDYALFLTTRHRQLVMDGVDPTEAAGRTVATSGRAVLIAALTVIIAMIGLYASGIGFIGKLGVAAAITVAVAGLAAVTLVPALLGMAGKRIDRRSVRRPVAEASAQGTGWPKYAERIGKHPWWYLVGGIVVMAILAIPMLSLNLGHVDAGADPSNYTDRQAYDEISTAFGPGANGPMTVVIDVSGVNTSQRQTLVASLPGALKATANVASVSPVRATPDGEVLTATVIPKTGPQDAATDTLLKTLRDSTLPGAVADTPAKAYVTGLTGAQLDFRNQVGSRLPVIIAVVIGAAFLLLLVSFRSPVLALKAALLNLLSIGAAYGVVVAVFQWGWGGSALGVAEKVPVESYVPMMMFAIVFGLSMDYEVFLLSRIREAWLGNRDNHASVASGLAATARVIGAAALIMASVFLAFLLSTNVVVKMLALGLGVSVLIDASVIRLVLVPAAMFLLGKANWWVPGWLDRILPHFDPEGAPPATGDGPDPSAAVADTVPARL